MLRVVHFEIESNDPGKAAAFYQDVFGWKVIKWEGSISTGWWRQALKRSWASMGACFAPTISFHAL